MCVVQSVTLVSCSEDDLHWRLDVASVPHGVFKFVQPTGAPFCMSQGRYICGCLACGQTETISVQFCPCKCQRPLCSASTFCDLLWICRPQNISFSSILPSIDIWLLFGLISQIPGLLYGFFFVSVFFSSFCCRSFLPL